MSLLDRLRDALGGQQESVVTRNARPDQAQQQQQSSGPGLTRRAARRVRRSAPNGERARRATRRASEGIAFDEPGRVRHGRGTTREQDIAERAESAASMAAPVEATLDPADTAGIDSLAQAGDARGREESAEPRRGGLDDLARGTGGEDGDGGWLSFDEPEEGEDDEWGWF